MSIKFSLSPVPLFLVPDIKTLVNFANGDLGISDQVKIDTIVKNVSKTTDEENLEQFKISAGFTLLNSNFTYLKNGKYSISSTDVILNHYDDLTGLKALEKSLIQSIFESQKPYADIFIQTVGCLVKVEDVIARVLSVGGSSLKPIYNPKALGYIPPNGKSDLNVGISQLKSLRDTVRGTSSNGSTQSGTANTSSPTLQIQNPQQSIIPPSGYEYDVVSTVYSTGDFDPLIKYDYEYIDILDDSIKESDLNGTSVNLLGSEIDPSKPRVVVFGIFDSKGKPLATIPDWLVKSGKWFGQFDMVSDFKYIWSKSGHSDILTLGSPGKGWNPKTDTNGTPLVILNNGDNIGTIKSYYDNLIQNNFDELSIPQEDQIDLRTQINEVLSGGSDGSLYQMQLDTLVSSGFLPTLQLVNNGKNPIGGYPFLPKNIIWSGTSSLPPVGATGPQVWIDPENDYDMKIIEVKPTFKVSFYDVTNKLVTGEIDPLSILENLQKNQVEVVTSLFQRVIINSSQITNIQLSINTPYSTGIYGSSNSDNKQDIAQLLRYATSLTDTETYYIVEGILQSSNDDQCFVVYDDGVKAKGSRYYRFPGGPISAIGAFIRMIIDVFSKLFPAINTLEKILANPASFIVESILLKKIGDNDGRENIKFDMFSKGFLDDFERLLSLPPSQRKGYVDSSKLRNYVYVNDDNSYKFLLDGDSSVEFLSFLFGIGLVNLVPKLNTNKKDDTQPIMNFLLNLVTFPVKIIKGIVEYIFNFFKSLGNPFSLPKQIVNFISFKWLLDFFNPLKLLALLGITFDIVKFGGWISSIDSYPDDHLFDLSEIIAMPFMPTLFTATKEQLLHLEKAPMELLSAIICLIADIINAFIDFIWALMGLKPILNPPHVTLCQDTNRTIMSNQTLTPEFGITGTASNSIESQFTQSLQSMSYLYNITLPDGTYLTDLTYDQLQVYLNKHKDLYFDFEF